MTEYVTARRTDTERALNKTNTRSKGVKDMAVFSMRLLVVLSFGHIELGELS